MRFGSQFLWLRASIAFLAGFISAGLLFLLALKKEDPIQEFPDEDALFFRPTPALKVSRIASELDETDSLAIALPEVQVLGNPRKEAYFADLIAAASQHTRVLIFINKNEPKAESQVRAMVAARVSDPRRVLQNVTFFPARVDTEWIRDYAPIFAIGSRGEKILLDAMYRDVRAEAQTARSMAGWTDFPSGTGSPYLSDVGTFWRRNDDSAPIYFNEFLHMIHSKYRAMVRPPIQLWGGDAVFEIPGTLITSTETLRLNGGNPHAFGATVSNYYGVTSVLYLRALPNTIGHLDLFLKMGQGNVTLLAQFDEPASYPSDLLRRSHALARENMEWNAQFLKNTLPGLKVVRVPMPPLAFSSLNPDGEGSQAVVSYRSALNSVAIVRHKQAVAVLIPDYPDVNGIRGTVLEAYRKAFPVAQFHFINASAIDDEFGGIHCTTVAFPDF